jgi:GalNAc-alpha-(1->4)-GalNAc-alpha-(1->3)-diNAcBac-PP-undecaprenol alpha-1,4-N-acetyl-D-galactosaminyltransferase
MKIFLVIPTLSLGGAERVMSVLANQMVLNNHVEIILLAKDEIFYPLNDKIKIHQLGFENKGKIQKIFSEINTFFQLRKIIKNNKPDVVLSFMTKYNIFVLLATIFLKVKVFVSDRCNPRREVGFKQNFLRNILYKKAYGIIAQTQLAKEILQKNTGNTNIKVIHNPISNITTFPYHEREKIIVNIGRLVRIKGQEKLIESFIKLNRNDWKLIILGDGPQKNNLELKIKELKAENNVVLMGAVKNIEEYLSKASIFVFPSLSEGFPNALAEAMISGLPCISFDCEAGPNEIIENNVNGILVEVNNFNQLKNKIELLMDNVDLRKQLATNASLIGEKLKEKTITEEYLNFFNLTKNK